MVFIMYVENSGHEPLKIYMYSFEDIVHDDIMRTP